MAKVRAWSNSLKKDIEVQKENIFKRDYKFFKIDRLERICERVDDYSDECKDCSDFKSELEVIVQNLAVSINGTPRERSTYEKRNELIVNHLKRVHELIHKDYFSSLYSFIGFSIGLILFGAISLLINSDYITFFLLLGFTVGIISGRIYGRKKDRLKENKGLIL